MSSCVMSLALPGRGQVERRERAPHRVLTATLRELRPGTDALGAARRADDASRWLVAAAEGDRAAFEALYRHTSRRLLGLAAHLLRDRARAEDVLQDAFVTIWRCARDYAPERSAAITWMSTIVRNRCFDALRSPAREVELPDDPDAWGPEVSADRPGDPVEGHVRRCDADAVRAAIGRLPGRYRQALVLAYAHGLAHADIAERLQVPVGTAKSWVRRGLAELRRLHARI